MEKKLDIVIAAQAIEKGGIEVVDIGVGTLGLPGSAFGDNDCVGLWEWKAALAVGTTLQSE